MKLNKINKVLFVTMLFMGTNLCADFFGGQITERFSAFGKESVPTEICGEAGGHHPLIVTVTRICPSNSIPSYFAKPRSFNTVTDKTGHFCVFVEALRTEDIHCEFELSLN